jgi:hypothetical protein
VGNIEQKTETTVSSFVTQSNSSALSPAPSRQLPTLLIVGLYAVAMAWVEAAVVFYLRTLADRVQPYQQAPLPLVAGLGEAELVREAATMIMLLTVGWLAGSYFRKRMAYALIAFGIWDIFYYVFLRVMTGWPASLLDWDVLFLIPLPWWGPVLAPVLIACLMIAWGVITVLTPEAGAFPASKAVWAVCAAGVVIALYVFMEETLKAAGHGSEAVRKVLPVRFNWPLFIPALGLMSMPILQAAVRFSNRRAFGTMDSKPEVRVILPQ